MAWLGEPQREGELMGAITLQAAQVIRGVDLKIADGEFVVFVGPSGCGKSMLLRMIGGLEEISRGGLLRRRAARRNAL